MSGAPGIRVRNILILAGVPHIATVMLEALSGTLQGGAPVLSRTIGSFTPESEVAEILREVEAGHSGTQIGSYPFFKDGRIGANFVVRATDPALLDACVSELVRRLQEAGRQVVAEVV
jgi:molybdopterin-biosynthesis enzyme MoeA-like protein